MSYKILIVDDEKSQQQVIEHLINNQLKYESISVNGGKEAIDLLTKKEIDIDLVILDLIMPDVDGFKVLKAVRPLQKDLPIIVRTGQDDIKMAVDALKAGATDFIQKLDSVDKLKKSINDALRLNSLRNEISKIRKDKGLSFDDIIGQSPAIMETKSLAMKVSASNIPILIEGESGVGKELLARAIHSASPRSDKSFVAVNCGAIPENLVESILFGHEKGAFTGALYKTFGKFREADGGTIFLDEVGELKPDIQVKLLRTLQEGEIEPVGSSKTVKIDVHVISATNRHLAEEVKLNNFREDLYYRLGVFPINIPSLRKRDGDIDLMIKEFYTKLSATEGKNISGISDKARDLLNQYHWPGNIRELKNAIFRAIVLSEKDILDIDDFPHIIAKKSVEEGSQLNNNENAVTSSSSNVIELFNSDGNFKKIAEIEKAIIKKAMDHYQGHMSKVAKNLGIGRSTLYRKIEEIGSE